MGGAGAVQGAMMLFMAMLRERVSAPPRGALPQIVERAMRSSHECP